MSAVPDVLPCSMFERHAPSPSLRALTASWTATSPCLCPCEVQFDSPPSEVRTAEAGTANMAVGYLGMESETVGSMGDVVMGCMAAGSAESEGQWISCAADGIANGIPYAAHDSARCCGNCSQGEVSERGSSIIEPTGARHEQASETEVEAVEGGAWTHSEAENGAGIPSAGSGAWAPLSEGIVTCIVPESVGEAVKCASGGGALEGGVRERAEESMDGGHGGEQTESKTSQLYGEAQGGGGGACTGASCAASIALAAAQDPEAAVGPAGGKVRTAAGTSAEGGVHATEAMPLCSVCHRTGGLATCAAARCEVILHPWCALKEGFRYTNQYRHCRCAAATLPHH